MSSHLPQPDPTPASVFLRPLGTPLPLGFVGLVVATGLLACMNLGWVPALEQHEVALVLMAFAFPLQFLATVLLFLARDAPSGAGIGVQSVTWLTVGLLLLTGHPGATSTTTGVFLFLAAGVLLPSALTSGLSKLVPAGVMVGTSLRFILTGVYEVGGRTAWEHAAGWEGIVLAGFALYAALASDLEGARRRTVLPLGRRGGGLPPDQGVAGQFPELAGEPGVRQQL